MNYQEAIARWRKDAPLFAARGVMLPGVHAYLPDAFKMDYRLAMDAMPQFRYALDAQPGLTTDPNSAIPALFSTFVDPTVFEVLFSPNMAAKIFGEERKGSWVDETIMLPVVEHTGEVSSYGDFSTNGSVNSNANWPQRQAYRYQTIVEYGELELERAGAAKINWLSELEQAAALTMNKWENTVYFFGVVGLQNYGLLNDPNLTASITPATKAYGGTKWFGTNGTATANEVYNDIVSLFKQLVSQNAGLVDAQASMTLAMDPNTAVALTFTNAFGVNVEDLLKKNYPNMKVQVAMQYGALSSSNPQGNAGGNLLQLIVDKVEGQDVGYCAFAEKMRAHKLIPDLSSYKQKKSGSSWGAIIRYAAGISSMLGV